MIYTKLKNSSGFTFIELMFAILMFGIVASAFLTVLKQSLSTKSNFKLKSDAYQVAQKVIEDKREAARLNQTLTSVPVVESGVETVGGTNYTYIISYCANIPSCGDHPPNCSGTPTASWNDLKEIDVQVFFDGRELACIETIIGNVDYSE